MSKILIVDNESFNFPENRDAPGWGEEVTDWATAVTNVLLNTSGPGDIIQTPAVIANNQAVVANINGMNFDPNVVRGAVIEYSIYRVTSLEEKVEVGTIYIAYKSTAATWEFVVVGSGGSGVTMSITNVGQVQYVSDNMAGASYTGSMKFRARALTI